MGTRLPDRMDFGTSVVGRNSCSWADIRLAARTHFDHMRGMWETCSGVEVGMRRT